MNHDQYMAGNALRLRPQGIYPTAMPNVWFQLHGFPNPYAALCVLGIDKATAGSEMNSKMRTFLNVLIGLVDVRSKGAGAHDDRE